MPKHFVVSQEGGFMLGEYPDAGTALRAGRMIYVKNPEHKGWRDAKVVTVFESGTMVTATKLFHSKAHFEGYLEGWNDGAASSDGDVNVNTSAAEEAAAL